MTEPADTSFEMVAAALRRDAADVATYARVLTETLGDALPPGCVSVERHQSMGDRLRGRPGEARRVVVRLGERVLSLSTAGGRPVAEVCHEVRGVVLSRDRVGLDTWIAALARELVAYADANARASAALERLVRHGTQT